MTETYVNTYAIEAFRKSLEKLLKDLREFYFKVRGMYPEPSRGYILNNLSTFITRLETLIEIYNIEFKKKSR